MNIFDEMMVLLTIMRHREFVSAGLTEVSNDFRKWARLHDRSKLMADEFEGYARINEAGRKDDFASVAVARASRAPAGQPSGMQACVSECDCMIAKDRVQYRVV